MIQHNEQKNFQCSYYIVCFAFVHFIFFVFNMRCYCCHYYYYCRAYSLLLSSSLYRIVLVYILYVYTVVHNVELLWKLWKKKKDIWKNVWYIVAYPCQKYIFAYCVTKNHRRLNCFHITLLYRPTTTHFQRIFLLFCSSKHYAYRIKTSQNLNQYRHNRIPRFWQIWFGYPAMRWKCALPKANVLVITYLYILLSEVVWDERKNKL